MLECSIRVCTNTCKQSRTPSQKRNKNVIGKDNVPFGRVVVCVCVRVQSLSEKMEKEGKKKHHKYNKIRVSMFRCASNQPFAVLERDRMHTKKQLGLSSFFLHFNHIIHNRVLFWILSFYFIFSSSFFFCLLSFMHQFASCCVSRFYMYLICYFSFENRFVIIFFVVFVLSVWLADWLAA